MRQLKPGRWGEGYASSSRWRRGAAHRLAVLRANGAIASGMEADADRVVEGDERIATLVADLLGATLVDAQDELWTAWKALERAGYPESARKWLY